MARTKYIWNVTNDTVLMEKDGNGVTQAVYNSDPVPYGRLFSMRRNNKTHNYQYDAQGNTRALTGETGQITDTYSYDAWGTQRTITGTTTNPYRYGGQVGYQYDKDSANYYVRARTYEPLTVRWSTVDPLWPKTDEPFYGYVSNAPSNSVDPSGQMSFESVGFDYVACKGVSWRIRWKLAKNERNGFIVQKVQMRQGFCECLKTGACGPLGLQTFSKCPADMRNGLRRPLGRGKGPIQTYTFYELWIVKDGKIYTNVPRKDGKVSIFEQLRPNSIHDNNVFSFPKKLPLCGRIWNLLEAGFVAGKIPPGGFGIWKVDRTHMSNTTAYTCRLPPAFKADDVVRSYQWRFCCCKTEKSCATAVGTVHGKHVYTFASPGMCPDVDCGK